ncbi:MAG TPA: DUF3343 domain-containing protein, partial [Spirochaetota bacterium]|nr:DUF3343 domain-containing protein [Spirochaetota bacterium]
MNEFSVVLFHSTNQAIWASKVFAQAGLEYSMIPVPRHLSSDCGYCLRIPSSLADAAAALMRDRGVEFERIAALDGQATS